MEMLKCDKCGKAFKNAQGLKIHVGRQHGRKDKAKAAKGKAKRAHKAVAVGPLVCKTCRRKFKLPAHLARHVSASHGKGKKARKVGRPAGRAVVLRGAPSGLDVRALTVDQLLTLKGQVDARLADIVRRMRAARVRI